MNDIFEDTFNQLDALCNSVKPISNPYVANLVAMGYDRQDCENVAAVGQDATYPRTIHGKVFQTEQEYKDALHEFLNGQ